MSQPALPVPATWAAGGIIPASELRANVSDAVAFLSSRPLLVTSNLEGSSLNAGQSALGCPDELYDNWSGHNSTSSSQYWCQVPGWYLCKSSVPFNYTSATQVAFAGGFAGVNSGITMTAVYGQLQLNGSTHQLAPQTCDLIPQTVTGPIGGSGDYLQAVAYNGSSGAVSLVNTTALFPFFSVRWVAMQSGSEPLPIPSNPAWPVPPSYVTSTFLNANIRDTIKFLLYPPICKLNYVAGTTTLPSTSFPAGTVINFNNITVDNYGGASTGASGGYTAPVAGVYFCYGQVNLNPSSASTGYCAGISVAGGTTLWGDSVFKVSDAIGGGMTVAKRVRLTAGQKVQLVGCQGTGGAVQYNATTPQNQTRLVVVWEGA